ncbi:MAG TPA: FHA domain-containing protein [Thermoanaerobaculaceae bacterium]|nr:FHA domain-containing protein [Thermoanaerobaculaceae bacterium]HRS16717.1 FHA domain-containing protein [Thermoanaerobaculaceae bacterium]
MASRRQVGFAVLAMVVCVLTAAAVGAQTLTKVKDIKANPRGYANEMVTVEGFATQWVESTATTTSFFFLKDDWGGIIKVRTSREKPDVGERYRVTGPVGIDVVNHNDPFISEETRVAVRPEPIAPAPVTVAPTPVPLPVAIEPAVPTALIAAVAGAIVILAGLLVWVLRSRRPAAEGAGTAAGVAATGFGGSEADAPPQAVEGRTIKMFAPPPGTLKILPGRLEVVGGDETVKEIRFYRIKGQVTPEVTFGRVAGPAYSHVQLKPMTVSSRQAKLTFINNQWILTNFAAATSNPTRYNGAELPVDGQVVLKQGDRIEMGEVQLVFHES